MPKRRLATDNLIFETLYNQQVIIKRYPGVMMAALDKEIQRTVQQEIRTCLRNCGYISENENN
jgi:hypothetical protein